MMIWRDVLFSSVGSCGSNTCTKNCQCGIPVCFRAISRLLYITKDLIIRAVLFDLIDDVFDW